MRIGLSTSVIQRGKTGVAQYVFGLVRALLPFSRQHRFTLFVLEEDLPLFDFAKSHLDLVSVPERFRTPLRNILWHQATLPRLARRLRLEVLHVPSYRRMLWPRPCRLVATIHDLAPFYLTTKYDRRRSFYARVVARFLARRQDRIIAISQHTAQDIRSFFGLPPQGVTVIHNGLDHQRFFPGDREQARAELAARYGLQRPFFLYVARLEHPAKNHLRLLEAFAQFKAATHSEWQLAFAGADWHGAAAIHAAVRQSAVAGDVRCLGFVPDEHLPSLYRAADAFVYPSLHEGFGLPPLEAMACACPVIASTRGALAEVLGEAAAPVRPEDLHTITKQLFIVATDAAARNRLRAAGLAQARKFDWQRTAMQTLQVYEQAAVSGLTNQPCISITKTTATAHR